MLTKRNMGKGKVRVTFTMPALDGVDQLYLVGDFNNWSIVAHPMKRDAEDAWNTAVTLDAGRDYQFRYLADGERWHNDWAADSYAPNEYGSENSVVNTGETAKPKAASKRAPAKKKL